MYKTSVYTLVNGNTKELAHRKQQKSQKVHIFFSSTLTHSQCDAGNITFCDFCCFRCASSLMLPLTSVQTDVLYIYLHKVYFIYLFVR